MEDLAIDQFDIKQAKITKSAISQEIKEYCSRQPELKAIMTFYRDVFGIQKRYAARIPAQMPNLSSEEISRRMESRQPLIESGDIKLDLEMLRDIAKDISEVIELKSPSPPNGLARSIGKKTTDKKWLERFVQSFIQKNEGNMAQIAKEADLEPALASLLAHTMLAPFYWKKSIGLRKKAPLGQVLSGFCPICGSRPVMAFLRAEDGLRVLECSLCGTRWGTPRMICLFCGTRDQKSLRYYFVEEDKSRRVYVCDNCLSYLKVSDLTPRPGEILVPLEDFATSYLDQLAQDKGYKRVSSTVFS